MNDLSLLADMVGRTSVFPMDGTAAVAGFFLSLSIISIGIWFARRTKRQIQPIPVKVFWCFVGAAVCSSAVFALDFATSRSYLEIYHRMGRNLWIDSFHYPRLISAFLCGVLSVLWAMTGIVWPIRLVLKKSTHRTRKAFFMLLSATAGLAAIVAMTTFLIDRPIEPLLLPAAAALLLVSGLAIGVGTALKDRKRLSLPAAQGEELPCP